MRARQTLDDGFIEPLTLAALAQEVGVHPAHLATVFRRHYGRTVGDRLRLLRVEHARHRLNESDASISEIALECGFSDQSHFGKVYRQVTGMTPAEQRPSVGKLPTHAPKNEF